jgi:predicted nucleic acid-binding protein
VPRIALSAGSAEPPARLVLDAGPLIALLHAEDRDHEEARSGFRRLIDSRTDLLVPLPILFEVYKWLLYETKPDVARDALRRMRRAFHVLYPTEAEIGALSILVESMADWRGSLEDALVALVGLQTAAPVWTLNYRDLSAFRTLRFWTPG